MHGEAGTCPDPRPRLEGTGVREGHRALMRKGETCKWPTGAQRRRDHRPMPPPHNIPPFPLGMWHWALESTPL